MDFTERNYYLLDLDYEQNNPVPHQLKSYFHCKIHCRPYKYEGLRLYHCVSVSKSRHKNLITYLDDHKIDYVPVIKEPVFKDGYLVCEEDPTILEAQRIASLCKRIEKERQEYEATRKLQRIKMLDYMTQITDLNIDGIVVSGKNKYGENSIISVDNCFFMAKLINMCKETLEEGIDL